MENFNKVVSFLLGLVVVIVFFAIVTGRLSLKDKFSFLATKLPKKNEEVVRPTLVVPQTKEVTSNSVREENNGQSPADNLKTIPATGLPTITLPLLTSVAAAGFYIKKRW